MTLTWKCAMDRWNLTNDDDAIVGAVTHEVLACAPWLFESERARYGWPALPPPPSRLEVEWQPLPLAEVMAILDGDTS